MTDAPEPVVSPDLSELEGLVEAALQRGDEAGLAVIDYGEISVVLGWPTEQPTVVAKRLPPFASPAAAARYDDVFTRYLAELRSRGVTPVDSRLTTVSRSDGRVVVYCVQPLLPATTLASNHLGEIAADAEDEGAGLLGGIVDAIFAVANDGLFLDGQLSNWAWTPEGLRYLDVTTPMLRSADGDEELDPDLFIASLPWMLRAPVRRFVMPSILARFRAPRTIVLDLAANLVKERLDRWIPTVLELANPRLDEPLTETEVRKDYASDARMWALLQRLRRADRAWQRGVRRRPYPFLLPAHIER